MDRFPVILMAAALAILTGCAAAPAEPDSLPESSQESSLPSSETPSSPLAVTSAGEIAAELEAAVRAVRQPAVFDLSGSELEEPEIAVQNLFSSLLGEDPSLKYAYRITAGLEGTLLTCEISYMPYRTGAFPADWQGIEVGSLRELVAVAREHLGEDQVPLRLTDPSLLPDDMSRALQQVGGGYLLCSLSQDGLYLTYSPARDLTVQDCLDALAQAEELAQAVVDEVTTPEMTGRERAAALYDYLIGTVDYDRRYYTDPAQLPLESQTAVGALRDHLAICGGYSLALQLLYEKAGIPCYTVSGTFGSENHMWNLALLDGEWLWFDATTDRGLPEGAERRHFAQTELESRQSITGETRRSLEALLGAAL